MSFLKMPEIKLKMHESMNTFKPKNLDRVVRNEIHGEELKLGESAKETGGPGACPREKFP